MSSYALLTEPRKANLLTGLVEIIYFLLSYAQTHCGRGHLEAALSALHEVYVVVRSHFYPRYRPA